MQMAHLGNLFLVRWDLPSRASCAAVRAAFEARARRGKAVFVAQFPSDTATIEPQHCEALVELMQDILPSCAHVAVVIETAGPNASLLRAALSQLRTSSSRHYGISIVGSIERALVWAPGPMPSEDELRAVLDESCYVEPVLKVA